MSKGSRIATLNFLSGLHYNILKFDYKVLLPEKEIPLSLSLSGRYESSLMFTGLIPFKSTG